MKAEIPEWLKTRLLLIPPLVPVIVGIGVEASWWSPTTTLVSLLDTLAVGLLAVILGKRVTEANAERELRTELDLMALQETENYELRLWQEAELKELAKKS